MKNVAPKKTLTEIFRQHKVLICVGSGGVGKTTVSAALAVQAAKDGLRVLVMTIDPSKRLRVALGLDTNISKSVLVPNQSYSGKIYAMLLDAESIFKEFILSSSTNSELAQKLLNNRLYQQLSTTLSGSQEFTSLLQLSRIAQQNEYDLIILDTPPAQHAVDFIEAPQKIEALFQEAIVRWFIGEEEVGIIRKIVSRGTRTVFSALELITGNRFMVELNDFFKSVKSLQNKISQKTRDVQRILESETTGFILVTGFDAAKLREAELLNQYLESKNFHMVASIINRAFPTWSKNSKLEYSEKLMATYRNWAHYHGEREKIFNEFHDRWSTKLSVVRIPDLNKDVYGLNGLEVVAHELCTSFSDTHSHDDRVL